MISNKTDTGEWRLDSNITYYEEKKTYDYLFYADEYHFTGRIKYKTGSDGKIEVQFEVAYKMPAKKMTVTEGHLWWKKQREVTTPGKIKKVWLYDWSFNWYTYPTEVIYGCTTTSTDD